jgi:hypothetical protein
MDRVLPPHDGNCVPDVTARSFGALLRDAELTGVEYGVVPHTTKEEGVLDYTPEAIQTGEHVGLIVIIRQIGDVISVTAASLLQISWEWRRDRISFLALEEVLKRGMQVLMDLANISD